MRRANSCACAATARAWTWNRVIDPQDIDLIQNLIARHAELTGSPRAKWILDNWETMLPKFVKVFPHEYKRVLGCQARTGPLESGIRNPRIPSPAPSPGRCSVGKPTGFMEYTRELPRAGRWQSA